MSVFSSSSIWPCIYKYTVYIQIFIFFVVAAPTLETDIIWNRSNFPNQCGSHQHNPTSRNTLVPKVPKLVWVRAQTATDKAVAISRGGFMRPTYMECWSHPVVVSGNCHASIFRKIISANMLGGTPCGLEIGRSIRSAKLFGDSSWCMFSVCENALIIEYVILLLPKQKWTRKSYIYLYTRILNFLCYNRNAQWFYVHLLVAVRT